MEVISKSSQVCLSHYLLKIKCDKACDAGQFVSIKYGSLTDPLIRRPFSIFNFENNTIDIIFKEAGKVTSLLKDCNDLSLLNIAGPYGKGFTLSQNTNVLLIGGGVGNAPLHYLAKVLKKNNCTVDYIYAARSDKYIYEKEKYAATCDNLIFVTDDGSYGEKGYANEMLNTYLKSTTPTFVYICGPSVMMKSCAAVLQSKNVNFEVSLENYFGCGIGICSGCAVDTTEGKKRACVNGPVFNGNIIKWDLI